MSAIGRLRQIWQEETGLLDPRAWLATCLVRLIPEGAGGRLRTGLYRLCGMEIGPGSVLAGTLTLGSARGSLGRIRIGRRCFINREVFIDAAAPVRLGSGVALGHHVVIITTDHALGSAQYRAGDKSCAPVTIGDGAWIAARATLLPGATIGAGAVVAAGAVVRGNVPPNVLVGGVPARVIRHLDGDGREASGVTRPFTESLRPHERAAYSHAVDHDRDPHLQPEGEPAEHPAGAGVSGRRLL